MKLLCKFFTVAILLIVLISCKETKTDNSSSTITETIEKVKTIETELENITESIEQKAEDLDKSLDALDDI